MVGIPFYIAGEMKHHEKILYTIGKKPHINLGISIL